MRGWVIHDSRNWLNLAKAPLEKKLIGICLISFAGLNNRLT
mgnify:CR=1 FL=1